jgi:hypothetical protein
MQCTPGRILQHLDTSVGFTADSLQILGMSVLSRLLVFVGTILMLCVVYSAG